jgi:NADH-quinone oxidoreductase subunit C/D
MPKSWVGHPLRKEHPARATEMGPYQLPPDKGSGRAGGAALPSGRMGHERERDGSDFIFLNVGPQHPGTHGVLRIALQLDGEEVVDAIPQIGFHHRGAEKMGERQSWHSYIPYTDRIDYLGGVMNNLAYLTAVEKLAGITVPPRAQVIRVMLSELFRIISHLVWYGTFAQDLGQMSPVFFTFNDRERAFEIVEAITGARMHPAVVSHRRSRGRLAQGLGEMFRDFIKYLPPRLIEYDRTVMRNRIFKARTKGIGGLTVNEAIEWGMTGPNLRACGFEWDFRKRQPYSGYEQFQFDIPTAQNGDCYDRAGGARRGDAAEPAHHRAMREEHARGSVSFGSPLATPPVKDRTMHDIETLITHFLNVSWGPVMPVGEVLGAIEGTKGNNGYYLVSDGSTVSYRTRIRTPSFAHIQTLRHAVAGSDDSGCGCEFGQPGFCVGGCRSVRN